MQGIPLSGPEIRFTKCIHSPSTAAIRNLWRIGLAGGTPKGHGGRGQIRTTCSQCQAIIALIALMAIITSIPSPTPAMAPNQLGWLHRLPEPTSHDVDPCTEYIRLRFPQHCHRAQIPSVLEAKGPDPFRAEEVARQRISRTSTRSANAVEMI